MSDNKKSNKFSLRVKPPKSAQLNKTVIIIVFGVLLVLINLAMVNALTYHSSKQAAAKNAIMIKPTNNENAQQKMQQAIQQLPADYQDMSGVKSYLNDAFNGHVPSSIQKELKILRSEQAALATKLEHLNQRSVYNPYNISAKQALRSGLFFPGVSPPLPQQSMKRHESAEKSNLMLASKHAGKAYAHLSDYEKQNMQADKEAFLKTRASDEDDAGDVYNPHSLMHLLSPYEIQAGTIIPATLLTGIDTSLPGDAVAQIRENIYDTVSGQYLLIPKGSKLLGQYQSKISYGQARVLIAFTRVICPDGSSILLSKLGGVDAKGYAGMSGTVDSHWGRVTGAAVLSTLLSVGTGVATDSINVNAAKNGVLTGAQNISEVGQDLTNRAINVQPTLTIPMGYQFNIIANRDIILRPYQV